MSFHFSILRLLLVIAIFAAALGLVKPLGLWGIPVAILVAIPLAGIVFIAKASDGIPIVRSFVSCVFGAFIGLLFCPMIHTPYELGDEFLYMMAGAIIGWICGLAIRSRRASPRRSRWRREVPARKVVMKFAKAADLSIEKGVS